MSGMGNVLFTDNPSVVAARTAGGIFRRSFLKRRLNTLKTGRVPACVIPRILGVDRWTENR